MALSLGMSDRKILLVSATKDVTKYKDTLLWSSYYDNLESQADIKFVCGNDGLSSAYNEFISHDISEQYEFVVFVHDDVYIDDLKLRAKLYDSSYDIIGLAGTGNLTIKKPCLWHLMSERNFHSGCVGHTMGSMIHSTTFGPYPQRCLVLDGLFLAVNLDRALSADWKFNENYTFHHYDLSSCIDANNKKLRLGTSDIHVVHNSPGLSDINDKVFAKSQETFYNEYKTT